MFMFPAEYHSDFPDSPLYSHWFLCGGRGEAGCFEARSSSVALVGLEFTQAGLEFVSHSASDIFFLHTFQHRKMSSDFHKQYFRLCIHQNTLTLLKGWGWKGTPLLIKWEIFFWILQALQPVLSPNSHLPQENLSLCTIAPNTSAFTHSYPSQIPLLLCFVLVFCSFLLLVLY